MLLSILSFRTLHGVQLSLCEVLQGICFPLQVDQRSAEGDGAVTRRGVLTERRDVT